MCSHVPTAEGLMLVQGKVDAGMSVYYITEQVSMDAGVLRVSPACQGLIGP